ncbi:hypothetical protein OB920_04090 [Halobacteria archaeon HArc-gm2]|nr:hypothetical protein [Halobacteria archaeon HArc-gm2]
MLSRETRVHVLCVVVGVAAFGVLAVTSITETPGGQVLAIGVFYGLSHAGAHLYFALRGEDGMIPVSSRWRFVGVVAALVVLMVVLATAREIEIAGVTVGSIAGWTYGFLVIAYFLVEGVAGYRQTIQEP